MNFTVVWREIALETIAHLWTIHPDRGSITEAVEEVDRRLGENPTDLGEEYYGDRLLIIRRLAITFQVSEDDRIVEIVDVYWHPL